MSRIYGSSHIEVYVCRFFKEQAAYKRCAVAFYAPVLIHGVVAEIILGIFNDLINSNNTLGNKINAFYLCNGGDIRLLKGKRCTQRLMQIFCRLILDNAYNL